MPSPAPSAPAPRDRLSELPDFLLGNILSYLPTKEAGCAAALSRRWRNIFCNVHTISFEEQEGERATDWDTFYIQAEERKSCSGVLLDDVSSALLCRRRTGGFVPLRCFRFAFDDCHCWNEAHVDQWLDHVLQINRQHELHLDLCFRLGPVCRSRIDTSGSYRSYRRYEGEEEEVGSGTENSDAEVDDGGHRKFKPWCYVLPRRVFSSMTLRTLCISNCRMNLPKTVDLPLLETLSITNPRRDGGRSVQRLISSCPRLVDLTLQGIRRLRSVSVLDKRLRRLALRCCHNLRSVDIDASELMSLDYCGATPMESLLSLHGSPGIPSCTVDFCEAPSSEEERDRFAIFMRTISGARQLHLHHQHLPPSCFDDGLPSFSSLTRLALQGPLQSPDVVRRILEQAPNLEILSLLMEFSKVSEEWVMAPEESSFSVPCLRSRVKEINMVHYDGSARMVARLLLRNALVLETMCVVFVKGLFEVQNGLKKEIESWMVAGKVEKIFL